MTYGCPTETFGHDKLLKYTFARGSGVRARHSIYLRAVPLDRSGGAFEPSRGRVISSNYWSSTTYAGNTTNAWNVNFNDGNTNNNNKTNTNYVRCVRG